MQNNVKDSIESSANNATFKTKNLPLKGFEKFKLVFILAFLSAIAPLSTDMYLPALPSVSQSFGADDFYSQLSLASFFIAFALGQLIYGPLSDIFGRKKPLYFGLLLFIISSIGCVLVDSIYFFIAFRFLEALGGCCGVVIARAIVNDRFEIKDAIGVFALMMVVSSLAPMLSPSFGSILLKFFSWHSIFFTLFILGVVLFLLVLFVLPESHIPSTTQDSNPISTYIRIFKDKTFMIYVLSGSLAMASMFAYITGSSFIFMNIFHLSNEGYSLIFALNALGFIICANVNARLVRTFSPLRIISSAFIFMCIFAILLLIIGFLANDLRADSTNLSFIDFFIFKAHWQFVAFECLLLCTLAMLGFLLPNITTLAMARFKEHSGSASAMLGCMQFAFAGATSSLVGALNANTTLLLSSVMCGCVLLGSFFYFFIKKS